MARFALMFVPTLTKLADGMEPKAWTIEAPHSDAAMQRGVGLATQHLGIEEQIYGDGSPGLTNIYPDLHAIEPWGVLHYVECEVEALPIAA